MGFQYTMSIRTHNGNIKEIFKEEIMFTERHTTHSRWASESEIKSSLYKVNLDGENPRCGGIPLFSETGAVFV